MWLSEDQLTRLGTLGLALAIDGLCGELPTSIHPVVWIGQLISALERRAPKSGKVGQLAAGVGIAIVVPVAAALPAALIEYATRAWPLPARIIVGALALKPTFAARDLFAHIERIRCPLVERRDATGELTDAGLADARAALQMIVSRDTSVLTEELIVAAAIESAAENLADSFVAPLGYYAMFGLAGALAYRASNTLDAMIGYHGKYEYLGKASARLDDLLNIVPARLAAALVALASPLGAGDTRRAWRIALAHHRRTESPNAGWPMSAMAGALGVELTKVGHYRLGEPIEPLKASQIRRATRIALGAMGITVLATVACLARRR